MLEFLAKLEENSFCPTNRIIKLMFEIFKETGSVHDNRRIIHHSDLSTEN